MHDCLVISETRTNSKPKRQVDSDQYILTQIPAQSTLEFYIVIISVTYPSIIMLTVKCINKIV